MRNNIWVKTTYQAAHEIVYFLPFIIIFNHFLVHLELAVAALGLLICYLLGFAIGKYKMVRFLEWLSCLVIAAIVSLLIVGINWSGLSFILAAFVAANRGISFRYFEWHELFRGNAYVFCICVYFTAPITAMFFTELKSSSPYLFWAGLYCLIHALYTLNRRQLEQASHNKRNDQSIAKPIILVNRMGTSIMIIVLILMINIKDLSQIIGSWFISLFGWTFRILMIISPESEQLSGFNGEPMIDEGFVLPPPEEKGIIAELFDMFIYYGAFILEAILAIGLLYFIIFKLLLPLYSRFITKAKLERESTDGYSDEEEKLEIPNIGNWFRSMMKRNPNLVPKDNKERVRYFYRETIKAAIKRGQQFGLSQTPLEIEQGWHAEKANHRLPRRLMALYNKARYGESQISEDEMKQLKEME